MGFFGLAAIASLALPPIDFTPAILCLSWPAYHLAKATTQRNAFWIAGVMGLGWFVASTHWTAHSLLVGTAEFWYLLPLAAIGVPAILSCFWAVAGALAWRLGETESGRILWLIVALSLTEFARGFVATGFPWNAPGYAFSATLASLQSASWFGLYGLNIFVFAAACTPAIWAFGSRRVAYILLIVPGLLTAAGFMRLSHAEFNGQQTLKSVRLVQPNYSQEVKWDKSRRRVNLQELVTLSRGEKPVPQLIIWPETAFTGFMDSDARLLRQTAIEATPIDGYLITGLLRMAEGRRLHNSAVLMNGEGVVQHIYDKRRLVPFGEFAPFRDWLPFVDVIAGPQDFSPGRVHQLFDVPGFGLVQMSICYESIFPGGLISGDTRPDMIVNITNDGWFGRTLGPWQHLAQAQMRAVEEGIPLIRVANTGISAAFDPYGRRLGGLSHGTKGAVDVGVSAPVSIPIFARYRFLPFVLLLIIASILAWYLDGKRAFRH